MGAELQDQFASNVNAAGMASRSRPAQNNIKTVPGNLSVSWADSDAFCSLEGAKFLHN
jgi:hypothetical protein